MAEAPPLYEPPNHLAAKEFFKESLPHRIKDANQVNATF